ncbi:MAG: hypothetical protein ACXWT0_00120 [Methylobacter sp.]
MKTLRDVVLDIYADLKQQIDNGELSDAFVNDAYLLSDGTPRVIVTRFCTPAIREIKIDIVLTIGDKEVIDKTPFSFEIKQPIAFSSDDIALGSDGGRFDRAMLNKQIENMLRNSQVVGNGTAH